LKHHRLKPGGVHNLKINGAGKHQRRSS